MITFGLELSNLISLRSNLISSSSSPNNQLSPSCSARHLAFLDELKMMKVADLDSRIKIGRTMLYEQEFLGSCVRPNEELNFEFLVSRTDIGNQIIMLEQYRNHLYFRLESTHLRMMLRTTNLDSDQESCPDAKLSRYIQKDKDRILRLRKEMQFLYTKLPGRKMFQVAMHLAGDSGHTSQRRRAGYLRAYRRQVSQ